MAQITWNTLAGKPALQKLWNRIDLQSPKRITPDDVCDACNEFCELFPCAEFGGGHIIISDFNTETHNIAFGIQGCAEDLGTDEDRNGIETIHFLSCLLMLDDDERIVHGTEGYEHCQRHGTA